jgi:hypothetical protein
MRRVTDHAELAEIIRERQGYVFNNRTDRRMLHAAGCEALEVMSTRAYEKVFFEGLDEARRWLDNQYGPNGWEVCGRCR